MNKFIELIKGLEGLCALSAASTSEIEKAEKSLGLAFADDYKEYLEQFGAISANGIELTGIVPSSKRLDVVSVTKSERELNSIPDDMYVIENIGIDGIIILQNKLGEIFSIMPHEKPKKIGDSFADYLKSKIS